MSNLAQRASMQADDSPIKCLGLYGDTVFAGSESGMLRMWDSEVCRLHFVVFETCCRLIAA